MAGRLAVGGGSGHFESCGRGDGHAPPVAGCATSYSPLLVKLQPVAPPHFSAWLSASRMKPDLVSV